MATIASVDIALTANSARLRRGLNEAERATQRYTRRARSQYQQLTQSVRNLQTVFLGFVAATGAGSLIRLSDTFTQVNNLLRASGVEAEDLADTFGVVQDIAIRTRGDLDAIGSLFAVLNRNAENLGATQQEIAAATTTVSLAFQLAGASTQEAAGATRQLSQALASGVLRGQELNSVMEQAPLLARAIAQELGVGLGELRQLAMEGRVTSDVVFRALVRNAANFNEQFMSSTATFGQLGNVLRTRIIPAIGELGQQLIPAASRAMSALATIIEVVAEHFSTIATIVAGVLISRFAILASRGVGALITSFSALRASSLTLIGVLRGVRVAIAGLGGPIGLIFFAVTELVILFYDELISALRAVGNAVIDLANLIIDAANNFGAGIERFERFEATAEETTETVDEFTLQLEELADGLEEIGTGADDAETMLTSFERTLANATDTAARMSELGSRVFDGFADSITNFVTTGRANIRQFANDIIREFIRIQVRSALAQSFSGSGLFGGIFRQNGGPVAAGQPYIVGEAGPELFVPNQSGNIVPNNAIGQGNGTSNVTYNINATDARSFRQLVAEDPSFIYNVSERGRRERPGIR